MNTQTTKNEKNIADKASQGAIIAKTAYEETVMARAIDRAGANPHLKGHIHEVLTADRKNIGNLFNGRLTQLTKNVNASTVDLVTTQGRKVVERLQLKDTISPHSINKLVNQVANGKYQSAQLVGTKETTQLVNAALEKAGLAKRMTSSGISSKTTTTLAQRAGASGSGTLSKAVMSSAKSGGIFGAGIAAGIEAISGTVDMINGKRDAGEVVRSTVKAGAKGGISVAATSAIVTAAEATYFGTVLVAAPIAAPLVIASAVCWVVSELFDAIVD